MNESSNKQELVATEQNDVIIYHSKDGKINVALMTRDGNVWLSQQQIATLFGTSVPNVNMHISNILKERELSADSVIKNYLTTASDGKPYDVMYYSLQMIIAIGFRVRGVRGTQFRQWANAHLSEYLVKGFTMDDERLKNPDGRPDYFDEMLQRIRDIRASEKRFYQKLRDLFHLSSDYEAKEKATQMFFAETQNKLLYAVTGHTAAEIIVERADAEKPNMGLTSWKGSVVRKADIVIAKNYLQTEEIDKLNRLVNIFLESAELRVKDRKDLTLDYWRDNVNGLLSFQGQKILNGNGSVSNSVMENHVKHVYETFDSRRKAYEAVLADQEDLKLLEELERRVNVDKKGN
ncbi:MAG: virulence RhuM family protein [Bacteroidales bacterium]|nr:virulence RhuM family protein [Bacteroidales bacterium]MDD6751838.1 virulence RhuM family protein [Bacteroidales bacterium]